MYTLAIIKILLVVAVSVGSQEFETTVQPQQNVEVTVYYEALCPDSVKFFKEQLTPHLDIINKYVQLKHVPFGKAKHEFVNGAWTSTCRHTSRECEGHQAQACALLQEGLDAPLKNAFISCLMKRGDRNKPYPTDECATEVSFASDEVAYQAFNICLIEKQYDSKIEEFKTETNALQPQLKNVPTIVFNGAYKQKDQDLAVRDFKKVLCDYIQADSVVVAPECAEEAHVQHHGPQTPDHSQQKVEVAVYYEALCPDSVKFFKEQLTPHLDIINKYVQLKHVPFGKATHNMVNGVWTSVCRHTNTECEGHEVQACALLQEGLDPALRNAFISCLMKRGARNKPYPTDTCATEVNLTSDDLTYQAVKTCIVDKQYDAKIEEFKAETQSLNPQLESVPTIVFNGVFKQSDQDEALKDFAKVLCHHIEVTYSKTVPECQTHRSAANIQVVSTLLLTVASALTIGHF